MGIASTSKYGEHFHDSLSSLEFDIRQGELPSLHFTSLRLLVVTTFLSPFAKTIFFQFVSSSMITDFYLLSPWPRGAPSLSSGAMDQNTFFSPKKRGGRGQSDPYSLFQICMITIDLMKIKYFLYSHTQAVHSTICGKRQACDRRSERLVHWQTNISPRT